MKLGVCLVTRNNPGPLVAVVMGLWRLRSTQHEIQFIFGVDADDKYTTKAYRLMGQIEPPLSVIKAPRAPCRGTMENRVLDRARELNCDLTTLMTDRTICITPGWDDVLARAATEAPKRPLWWSCPHDNVCAIPIMPRAYLDAIDWHWSPEIFPFWFDDTWHQQIDLIINGNLNQGPEYTPSLKVKASFAGQRGKTTRGREFGFWIDLFHRTLPIRIETAREVAAKLGLEFKCREDIMKYIASWYDQMKKGAASLEEHFGDPREPGPEYAIAKAQAERLMADMMKADMGINAEAAE